MGQNVLVQLQCRVELWIPAHDFVFRFGNIGEVDKVADHLPQPVLVEQALQHGMQRIDAFARRRFIPRDLLPCVEEFVLGKQRAHFVVDPIADNAQRVVLHQFGDIARVTYRQLFKCIV